MCIAACLTLGCVGRVSRADGHVSIIEEDGEECPATGVFVYALCNGGGRENDSAQVCVCVIFHSLLMQR